MTVLLAGDTVRYIDCYTRIDGVFLVPGESLTVMEDGLGEEGEGIQCLTNEGIEVIITVELLEWVA